MPAPALRDRVTDQVTILGNRSGQDGEMDLPIGIDGDDAHHRMGGLVAGQNGCAWSDPPGVACLGEV
jgi:hypothetical protein